jgi:hypothetical protein
MKPPMTFNLKLRKRGISEQDLLSDLKIVAEKIGAETVTAIAYDEHGEFGKTTILRKFGTWNKALSAAGLDLNNRLNISNEELFENLANVWQILGRQPFGRDISKSEISKFSLGTYEKRFGSWNKALTSFINYIESSNNEIPSEKIISAPKEKIISRKTQRKINWRIRATVLIRDNCICKMCGASPSKDPSVNLHVDHIKPYSKGGETLIDNLQTLCSVCNIGKSDEVF